ncbi:hypothetical protein AMJ57_00875 [Parcubacteria bacterium SG8_24]|nr:MAG: hypothetical protein AMJ57_00875 [Parcubacteria bacterium SG8_24]
MPEPFYSPVQVLRRAPVSGVTDAGSEVFREEEARIAVVEKVSPAVVSIVVSKDMPVFEQYMYDPFSGDEFFERFFGDGFGFSVPQYRQKGTERREVGAGTGFIVSADGYIVTNKHVVSEESAEYTVVTQDGSKHEAEVLARDPVNDIAVLRIPGEDHPFVELGDSDDVRVGQGVLAIGYALGRFSNSVSVGVVSGMQRSITASDGQHAAEDLFDVLQTDAAINPGNSGGPLLDLHGKAIGVNVAIVQGSENIGFALPIDDVRLAVDSVRQHGKILRPFLGVRYVMIDEEMAQENQLPVDYGALVVRGERQIDLAVTPGSPADLAGIVENDIILEVGGERLTQSHPLVVAIRGYRVGDTVTLKILHKGQETEVQVTLQERQ